MKEQRNYGIDLLRLVLMFMICILHILGKGGILSSCVKGNIQYNIYWFLEVFSFCAVDAFAIISGYTANNKPRKYDKLVNMWFQIFFYCFILTLLFMALGINKNYNVDLIKNALPITYEAFWYMSAYFILFLVMPILNSYLFSIDDKIAKKMIIIIAILFSIMGIIGEPFGTFNGYSAIWLIVLYCLGFLAKKVKMFEEKRNSTLIILWILSLIITWFVYIYFNDKILINYVSPTILLNGLLMVILFSRIKLKGNIISKISPLALGIYLFQLNCVIWEVYINKSFEFIANMNVFLGVGLILLFASCLFILGLVVEFIRTKLASLIKLSLLSKKIIDYLDKLLDKIVFTLK